MPDCQAPTHANMCSHWGCKRWGKSLLVMQLIHTRQKRKIAYKQTFIARTCYCTRLRATPKKTRLSQIASRSGHCHNSHSACLPWHKVIDTHGLLRELLSCIFVCLERPAAALTHTVNGNDTVGNCEEERGSE